MARGWQQYCPKILLLQSTLQSCVIQNPNAKSHRWFLTANDHLLLVNASEIGAILLFFAIASESLASSVHDMAEKSVHLDLI